MTQQYITIRANHTNQEVDLEVPADQAMDSFMPDLVKVINWPQMIAGKDIHYQFVDEDGKKLDQSKSIKELGIENFDILWLTIENNQDLSKTSNSKVSSLKEPIDAHAAPLPPAWADIPIESPSLLSKQGIVFILGDKNMVIGRKSRDTLPDIDLSELDTQMLASRHHAEIIKDAQSYSLHALKTTNGTFINGEELPPNETKHLNKGDEIQFGFRGISLIFMN